MPKLSDRQYDDMEREATFWDGWTENDEAAFQADMRRILAKFRRVGAAQIVGSSSQSPSSLSLALDITPLLESSVAQEA